MSKLITRHQFLKAAGAAGAAGLLAACGGSGTSTTAASSAAVSTAPAGGEVSLSMSWWGGESRHEAYQKAIAAFMEEHGNITVNPMPLPDYYGINGENLVYQSAEWITGKVAGFFEWDSSAPKYKEALDEENRDGFTVGDEIKFGDHNGGFTKLSQGMAITQTCQHPVEAAMLINFILNEEAGASIMGSACGLPASKSGLAYAEAAGAIDPIVEEANAKIMAFCEFRPDPLFEDDFLKSPGTGVYQQVFDTMDYDNAPSSDLVELLLDGMQAAGYTV